MRQGPPDLLVELRFCPAAVIVGHEQETALQQVLAEPLHLDVAEVRRPGVFHQRKRALEQGVVGHPDDDRIRHLAFTRFVDELDADLGQLR